VSATHFSSTCSQAQSSGTTRTLSVRALRREGVDGAGEGLQPGRRVDVAGVVRRRHAVALALGLGIGASPKPGSAGSAARASMPRSMAARSVSMAASPAFTPTWRPPSPTRRICTAPFTEAGFTMR
jgi:hypothetical protein